MVMGLKSCVMWGTFHNFGFQVLHLCVSKWGFCILVETDMLWFGAKGRQETEVKVKSVLLVKWCEHLTENRFLLRSKWVMCV